ncbi:MAG: UDP-N-acetylmuramoyl-L-alanyl-D-glutamate--2,6-diaminopimelate ligase, partial [Anaplasmataceae bacterium]|nr:UDP-N-acetylmuramoyl-L-alanyl-D-glutamate--2,6-diaminopimelate ligase [Anaplasmataceae bacterium]
MTYIKKQGIRVIIDFAHTPDALKNAILSIKWHLIDSSRIITVFGCGGERDQHKRILMGRIAQELSDVVIICDDNPRNEDSQKIRNDIIVGCPQAIEIGNRGKAIEKAIELSKKGDIILIAGKGHEKYQIIGDKKYAFSDKDYVINYLKSYIN